MRMPKNLGTILLAAFLILFGLIELLSLSFRYSREVLGGVAIAAGIFVLLERR